MVFSVVNGKTFPEHEVEKIFQIGQAVQKFQFICKCYAITCNTCKFFLYRLVCQFITLPILDDNLTSNYQLWSLKKELLVDEVLRLQYI